MTAPGPVRVTMIGSLPPQKGVSRYTHDLCAALAADPAIELEVLAFKSLYPRWLYSGGDPVDVHAGFAPIAGARTRAVLRWWNPLGWILAGLTLRGDVVHAQWWSVPLAPVYVALLALARLRSRLVLVTLHNVEPHERGILRRVANRIVLPFAHHVIVHTQANARALAARGLGETRISVVAHGVGDHVPRDPADRAAARAALRLPPAAPVVLFLGNIRPYKGLDVLLEAFTGVRRDHPDAVLAIVGQLWAGATAPQPRIEALGMAAWTRLVLEYVPDAEMARWLDACDVSVYPYTHFDAQSGAAGQALRRGCPIIVSDVGGLAELVTDPRAVVPPASPAALAGAISRVLADRSLGEQLSHEAWETAERLAWPTVARTTAQLYAALQHRPPRSQARRGRGTAALTGARASGGRRKAAAPGGPLLAVAKRGAEQAMWSRVALQRRLEAWRYRDGPAGRPRPPAASPTGVLRTRAEWEEAVRLCRTLRLPLHHDRPKNWDALGALATVLTTCGTAARVLDAGSARYSPLLPWLRLYGLADLVGINLEFDRDVRRDGVRFRHGDVTATGFPDARFDAVTCLSVIEHGVPLEPFLREAARVLRPGGVLVVSTDYDEDPPDTSGLTMYGHGVHIFSPSDIREVVALAGSCGLHLLGHLELEHPQRPVHWDRTGLDYTFIRLSFRRS